MNLKKTNICYMISEYMNAKKLKIKIHQTSILKRWTFGHFVTHLIVNLLNWTDLLLTLDFPSSVNSPVFLELRFYLEVFYCSSPWMTLSHAHLSKVMNLSLQCQSNQTFLVQQQSKKIGLNVHWGIQAHTFASLSILVLDIGQVRQAVCLCNHKEPKYYRGPHADLRRVMEFVCIYTTCKSYH